MSSFLQRPSASEEAAQNMISCKFGLAWSSSQCVHASELHTRLQRFEHYRCVGACSVNTEPCLKKKALFCVRGTFEFFLVWRFFFYF